MTVLDDRVAPGRARTDPRGVVDLRDGVRASQARRLRQTGQRRGFRPDVEGLRAIAIGLVVAFHAGVGFVPGGFVGVDVFFVISGFLITGLIVRELQSTGTVSVSGFYARRAKRLLPATAVVLVLVTAVSMVVVSAVDRGQVGLDVVAAATYVANWRFGFAAVDYFAAGTPSPVLHFWSLAVEEQFYLVWPWLLLLVTRRARRSGTSLTPPLVGGLLLVAVPSLWWSAQQTASAPGWAYISSFTRAWELAIGGGIAMLVPLLGRTPRVVAALLGWAGLGAIAYAALRFSDAMPFPGTAALVPVLGAAALLVAGTRLPHDGASHLISGPRMQRVGAVSYSWYLWHWPMLVFAAILVGGELSLWQALPVIALAYGMAVLTRRIVEQPFHRSPALAAHPDRALRLGAVCTVIGVLAGLVLWVPTAVAEHAAPDAAGVPGAAALLGAPTASAQAKPATRPTAAPVTAHPSGAFVPALARIRGDYAAPYSDGCHQDWAGTDVPSCTYGVPDAPRTMVVFGDSHAATWFSPLEVIAHDRGWRLIDLTKNACPVADTTTWSTHLLRGYSECDTWRASAMARIAELKPDLVVATGRNDYRVMSGSTRMGQVSSASALTAALARTYRALDRVAGRVVVLRDNPMPGVDPVECLSRNQDAPSSCDRSFSQMRHEPRAEKAAAASAGVSYVDTLRMFCTASTCPAVIGGVVVWRDDDHATATYATTLAPYLSAALAKLGALA